MPNCPKCGQAIDKLYEYARGETKYEVYLGEDGEIHRDELDYLPDSEVEYECPECREVLFSNPGDADDFLSKP